MKITTKIRKTNKAVQTLIKNIIKSIKQFKTSMKKICLISVLLALCACGSTKVSVDKPAQGTSTTITVTTNNPITTEVNPQTDLKLK